MFIPRKQPRNKNRKVSNYGGGVTLASVGMYYDGYIRRLLATEDLLNKAVVRSTRQAIARNPLSVADSTGVSA